MPRPRTHKVSLQVKGLTEEQAAQMYYILTCVVAGFVDCDTAKYDTASNVQLKVLRTRFPDEDWGLATAAQRIALVR